MWFNELGVVLGWAGFVRVYLGIFACSYLTATGGFWVRGTYYFTLLLSTAAATAYSYLKCEKVSEQ